MKNHLLVSLCLLLGALPACGSSDGPPGHTANSLQGDRAKACAKGFSSDDAGGRVCNATFDSQCFESDRVACDCAACPEDDCLVLESYPTQIRCASSGSPSPNPDSPSSSSPEGPTSSDPGSSPPSGSSPGSPGGGSPPSPGTCAGGFPPGTGTACNVTHAGQCFETSAAACACAGCAATSCRILESFPAQVACD